MTDEPLVYDMEGWEPEERVALGLLLDGAGVAHSWDGDDLLVPEAAEAQVDEMMDRVEFPDALDAVDEEDDDGDDVDDEVVYAVMSDLYVAADRLARTDELDVDAAAELAAAVAAAAGAPPPYGVAPAQWVQVQQLGEGVLGAIDAGADDEVVRRDVTTLRDLLHRMV